MGVFGWGYPPGCSSVPGDEPCPPCPLCGKDPEKDCACPECPECGDVGCVKHLSLGNLLTRLEILHSQVHDFQMEYVRRQEEQAVQCPGCPIIILPDLNEGGPVWCPTCKKNIGLDGKFLPEGEDW
jgi:hypothetical protein